MTIGKEEQETLLNLNILLVQRQKKLAQYSYIIIAFLIFTMAAASDVYSDLKASGSLTQMLLLVSFILLLFGLGVGIFQRVFFQRILKREEKNTDVSNERGYIFSEEGVSISSEIGKGISYWSAFSVRGEIGHYIYLMRRDRKLVLIDKKRLSETELAVLASLLQNIKTDDRVNKDHDENGKSFRLRLFIIATVIIVIVSIIYACIGAFYPLSQGSRFRLWFSRTFPAILLIILQCMDLAWICILHRMIKKNENRKKRSIVQRILLWIIGAAAVLALAFGILSLAFNDDSEKENVNGTVTVRHPIWLDPTRYYLYQKENFLVLRYLRDADGPEDTDPSVTQEEYAEKRSKEEEDKAAREAQEKITADQKETSEDTADADEQLQETNGNQQIDKGYQKICQTYLDSPKPQYKESYDAKGNSYVIVFEDKTQIRYLIYDRDTDNGKYARYVYYQSDKGADGSWSLTEAKILDMYQYDYQSQAAEDLKKTSW